MAFFQSPHQGIDGNAKLGRYRYRFLGVARKFVFKKFVQELVLRVLYQRFDIVAERIAVLLQKSLKTI